MSAVLSAVSKYFQNFYKTKRTNDIGPTVYARLTSAINCKTKKSNFYNLCKNISKLIKRHQVQEMSMLKEQSVLNILCIEC